MNSTDPKVAFAHNAILSRFGTPEGRMDVNLFVSHHKEEVGGDEWENCLGTSNPGDHEVLLCLVLRASWDSKEDGIADTYDFTLPNGLTQYVLSVRFDGEKIDDIDMES